MPNNRVNSCVIWTAEFNARPHFNLRYGKRVMPELNMRYGKRSAPAGNVAWRRG